MQNTRYTTSKLPSFGTSSASLAVSSCRAADSSSDQESAPNRLSTARVVGRSNSKRTAEVSSSADVLRTMRLRNSVVAPGSGTRLPMT